MTITPKHYAILLEEISEISNMREQEKEIQALAMVMVKHHHEHWIDAIGRAAQALRVNLDVIPVAITTARALLPSDQTLIHQSLERELGKSVLCRFIVKPKLVGGATIRVRHCLIDASFQRQLTALRLHLTTHYV